MKILFDIGHAAHVHLFRQMIGVLQKNGHQVTVVSRDKPHVLALLDSYGIPHQCLSKPGKGLFALFGEWLLRTWKVLRLHQKLRFDVAIGTSVSISYLSLFGNVVSINVQEDDDAVIPLHVLLAYPLSSFIVNPKLLQFQHFAKKRLLHHSLHEMAYLSAAVFRPDKAVLNKYQLEPDQYVIVRKVKLNAHHDVGQSGLTAEHLNLLGTHAKNLTILQSNEVGTQKIEVADMHHLLAYARLLITDSQTMAAEAACLATPVLQVSSFDNKLSYISHLKRFGFLQSFKPAQVDEFTSALKQRLEQPESEPQRLEKRTQINLMFPDFTDEFFRLLRENDIVELP